MNLHLFYSFGFRRFRILRPRPTHARSTRRGGIGTRNKKGSQSCLFRKRSGPELLGGFFSGRFRGRTREALFELVDTAGRIDKFKQRSTRSAGFAVERVKRCLNLSIRPAVSMTFCLP